MSQTYELSALPLRANPATQAPAQAQIFRPSKFREDFSSDEILPPPECVFSPQWTQESLDRTRRIEAENRACEPRISLMGIFHKLLKKVSPKSRRRPSQESDVQVGEEIELHSREELDEAAERAGRNGLDLLEKSRRDILQPSSRQTNQKSSWSRLADQSY